MTNSDIPKDQKPLPEELDTALAKVRQALSKIRYGAVEIVVHNSRVVQIEAREKIRFDTENKKTDQASGSSEFKKYNQCGHFGPPDAQLNHGGKKV